MSKVKRTFTCRWNVRGFPCNSRVSEADGILFEEEIFPRLFNAQVCDVHINEFDRRVGELRRIKNLMKVTRHTSKLVKHIA